MSDIASQTPLPKRPANRAGYLKGEKRHWVCYGLQSLPMKRFIVVTNKLINGEYVLMSPAKAVEET